MKGLLWSRFVIVSIWAAFGPVITLKGDITGFGGTGVNWTINGGPSIVGDVLQITDGNFCEQRNAFFNTLQPIAAFTASFTWQNLTPPGGLYGLNPADGIVFTLQNQGLSVNPYSYYYWNCFGSSLGYEGINPATGVALNLYTGHVVGIGYAPTSVGNGSYSYSSTSPVDLDSRHPINVTLRYDGTTLRVDLMDTVTKASFSTAYAVDLVHDAAGSTAYVGFTGATGSGASDQRISNFSFKSQLNRPVIVIPGIMGSVLKSSTDDHQVLWIDTLKLLSKCDEFLLPLALNLDGVSPANTFTFTCASPMGGGINYVSAGIPAAPDTLMLGNTGPYSDYYSKLLTSLNNAGFSVQPFPYDWRLDYATAALQLKNLIDKLAPNPSDRVDVVAHSQGGLVARAYFQTYPQDHRINTIIYLGTPQLGATKSFAILSKWLPLESIYGSIIPQLNFSTGAFISQNFPGMYELLPRFDFYLIHNQIQPFKSTYAKLANGALAAC
jgi:hypothetical protein